MLLDKIGEEFEILKKIVNVNESPRNSKIINDIVFQNKQIDGNMMLSWNVDMRSFSRAEGALENRRFSSDVVQEYAQRYIDYVESIFIHYDILVAIFPQEMIPKIKLDIINEKSIIRDKVSNLYILLTEIELAAKLIPWIAEKTWESLPNNENEDDVNNIIISSETRSISLNDVASDVGNLDNFFNNICLIFNKDKHESNNIYLRKVETGSLAVVVSCLMETAPIIAFIFWCVKLYQKSEKRHLDNADKKLKLINESMNMAKEILKINPDNKEADEIIQKCGVHILNFLENNPKGTINGVSYDIGIEKLKIEEKD